MAAAMPPAVALSPPVSTPSRPCSATASAAPLASEYPNPVSGTVAPAPPQSTTYWYAPTGALLSTTSAFQGESIPGICHAVVLSRTKEDV